MNVWATGDSAGMVHSRVKPDAGYLEKILTPPTPLLKSGEEKVYLLNRTTERAPYWATRERRSAIGANACALKLLAQRKMFPRIRYRCLVSYVRYPRWHAESAGKISCYLKSCTVPVKLSNGKR